MSSLVKMQGLHKGISKGNISCKEEVIYNYIYYIIYTLPPYSVKNSSLIFFFPAWSLSHHTIGIFKCIFLPWVAGYRQFREPHIYTKHKVL